MTFHPYPSIDQLRQVIRGVSQTSAYMGKDESGEPIYDGSRPKPILKFRGTVKVHGTNAAITRVPEPTTEDPCAQRYEAQSRTRTLVAPDDNSGFRAWVDSLPRDVLDTLFEQFSLDEEVTIFGEWAGRGIQAGVAVAEVDRFFYIFAVKAGDEWKDPSLAADAPEHRIFNALDATRFPTWEVDIDFAVPERSQNYLVEVTEQVEKECPVGKALGTTGIGEGVVWVCVDEDRQYRGSSFKVKGEKHSVSKVKTLAPVDVERVKTVEEFADKVLTVPRLEQGVSWLREQGKEVSEKSTGDYLRWLVGDVLKEERDTMEASGITEREVGKIAGTRGRQWFFTFLKQNPLAA